MKFFSRKALVAGATAIAVSFAGVNVASAQSSSSVAPTSTAAAPSTPSDTSGETTTPSTTPKPVEGGSSDLRAKDIKEWIGVITAVVGALSAIYTFINKLTK